MKLLQSKIANDPEVMARFQREARSTTGLGHPNIVDTIDFGFAADGQPFLVMEWLDGENLDQRMSRGPLDIPTALDIAAQACAGLAAAHDRGVIHRDLKPANLFLTRDHRAALLVKVLDFGIAKLRLHETKLTATGVLIGTPNYMAPEQAEGDTIDARTDIYALGVIMYELIAGDVPFQGDTPLAVLHQHTSRLPKAPSARAPQRGISGALDALVMRCLAKRPDERYANMHELATAIADVQSARRAPAPTIPDENDRAPARRPPAPTMPDEDDLAPPRRRSWLVLAVLGALVLAGGAAVFWFLGHGARHEGRDAAVAMPTPDVRPAADGAVASTPIDAVADASVDAAPVIAGASFALRGHTFTGTIIARPAVPVAGEPVELSIELTSLDAKTRAAAKAGTLTATIELRYFKDHSLVEESSHPLDESARFTVTPRLAHAAKHHAHVDLLIDGKEVDHAKVDLFPDLR